MNPPPVTPTAEQSALYQAYRSYLEHEDDLVSARINWFIGLQSFLFAAFGLALQKKYEIAVAMTAEQSGLAMVRNAAAQLDLGLFALSLFGFLSSIAAIVGMTASFAAIRNLRRRYNTVSAAAPENYEAFPDLIGGGARFAGASGLFYSYTPPVAAAIIWMFAAAMATGHLDAPAWLAALGK